MDHHISSVMRTSSSVVSTLGLILISGCVTLGSMTVPSGIITKEHPAVVVSVRKDMTGLIPSPDVGSAFGLIGQLIVTEATKAARTTQSAQIQRSLEDFSVEKVLRERVVNVLTSKGYVIRDSGENISIPPHLSKDQSEDSLPLVWYNPDKSIFDHGSLISKFRAAAIIEVGFSDFHVWAYPKDRAVNSYSDDYRTDDRSLERVLRAVMLIKVYDANGNLIGRARAYRAGVKLGSYDLDNQTDIVLLAASLRKGTNQIIDSLLRDAFEKLGL